MIEDNPNFLLELLPEPCRLECAKAEMAARAVIFLANAAGRSREDAIKAFQDRVDPNCKGLKRPTVCGRDLDCGHDSGAGHWLGVVISTEFPAELT